MPSSRTVARLMTTARDNLSKAESVMIAAIEGGVPSVVEAREIIADFHAMVRKKAIMDLPSCTKLKLVKRQMYGRAKLDLLQARLMGAA